VEKITIGNVTPDLDTTSSTWAFIESYATQEIDALRRQNDSLNCDSVKTAAIRGGIKQLLKILALKDGDKPSKTRLNAGEE